MAESETLTTGYGSQSASPQASILLHFSDIDFVNVPGNLRCIRCQRPVIEAYQTVCGHKLCGACSRQVLELARKKTPEKCPGADSDCTFIEQALPDFAARRQINRLLVRCSNPGCDEQVQYNMLPDHFIQCRFAKVPETEDVKSENRELEEVWKRESADFQKQFSVLSKTVMDLGLKLEVTLANQAETISTSLSRIELLEQQLQQVISESERPSDRQDLRNARERLGSLETAFHDYRQKKLKNEARVLHEPSIPMVDGKLVWRIDKYWEKKKSALDDVKRSLYSAPFFSERFGYKMCARIYLNGDGSGRGTHLSVFFIILKGEYDELQSWPFNLQITFKLHALDGSENIQHSFYPDTLSSSFKRPVESMNVGTGLPQFAAQSQVESLRFLKDNCIYLEVRVRNT